MWIAKVGEVRRRWEVDEGVRMLNWIIGGFSETEVNEEQVIPRAVSVVGEEAVMTTTMGKRA